MLLPHFYGSRSRFTHQYQLRFHNQNCWLSLDRFYSTLRQNAVAEVSGNRHNNKCSLLTTIITVKDRNYN